MNSHSENPTNNLLVLSVIFLQGIFNLVLGIKGIYFLIEKSKLSSLLYFPYEIVIAMYKHPEIILYVLGFIMAIIIYIFFPLILVRTNTEKRFAKWTVIASTLALWIYITALANTI